MVFVRTAFFDILDMQGDRLIGKETIPILLGEKRSFRLLKGILISLIAILFFSSVFHLIKSLGFIIVICPVFIFIVLSVHERGSILPGIRLEFLVETLFILAGVIALLWSVLINS
jgi:4-hydroxy-3-methylbut-2-enyl diphosphate reductase